MSDSVPLTGADASPQSLPFSVPVKNDPFDPARLRLSQDFALSVGVKKLLTTVPVRKPSSEWWFRVHPDEAYRLTTLVLELKEDREVYLIDPVLWGELSTEANAKPVCLFTSVNRQGVVFLWPCKLPAPDGKILDWHRSALDAAKRASEKWVRMQADMSLGAYSIFETSASLPDPVWPELPMRELLAIAFQDKRIDTREHPVLRQLRGEI